MLTKEKILSTKVNAKSLEEIKKINLWGDDLENIDIISEMKSLEVVSLSLNKISSLKPFANCPNLRELYLRKNNISDLNEIDYLKNCPNLKILWLEENPICQNENYREKILSTLPQVIKLDNNLINNSNSNNANNPKKVPINSNNNMNSNIVNSNINDNQSNENTQKEIPNENNYNEENTNKYNEVNNNNNLAKIENLNNEIENEEDNNSNNIIYNESNNNNSSQTLKNTNIKSQRTLEQDKLINEALNNYNKSLKYDNSINVTKCNIPITPGIGLGMNTNTNKNMGTLTKAEEYLKKLDNIEDIKNYFNSPYGKNSHSSEPIKILPKLNDIALEKINNNNYGNYKPISDKNVNNYSQNQETTSYSVSDSLNNISPKNVHIVTAILNLMEGLNLKELIQIRDQIIYKLKK